MRHDVADGVDPLARRLGRRLVFVHHREEDDAAGVDDEVRRPDDPAGAEPLGAAAGRELVIRRSDDGLDAQFVDHFVGEDAADAGRNEQVALDQVRRLGLDPGRSEALRQRALDRVHVGDRQHRAFGSEAHREDRTDMAEAEHRDAAAGDLPAAERFLQGGEQTRVHARGGRVARLPDAALRRRKSADVAGARRDHCHVLGGRADILSRHVGAAQALDRVAEVEHGRVAFLSAQHGSAWHVDHRLAAATVETRGCVLHRHPLGEAQRIVERLDPVVVRPDTAAAERLPENSRMDRDADGETAPRPLHDEHTLVGQVLAGGGGQVNGRGGHRCLLVG